MTNHFHPKVAKEILSCGGSMCISIVMTHYNTVCKNAISLILDRQQNFVSILQDTCIDCWALIDPRNQLKTNAVYQDRLSRSTLKR